MLFFKSLWIKSRWSPFPPPLQLAILLIIIDNKLSGWSYNSVLAAVANVYRCTHLATAAACGVLFTQNGGMVAVANFTLCQVQWSHLMNWVFLCRHLALPVISLSLPSLYWRSWLCHFCDFDIFFWTTFQPKKSDCTRLRQWEYTAGKGVLSPLCHDPTSVTNDTCWPIKDLETK